MRWIRDIKPDSEFSRLFKQALLVTLMGNIVLAVTKSFVASISTSSAIYADAINSISDVLYSILLVVGLWISQRPPDISHPQGPSQFEPIAAMFVKVPMSIDRKSVV